MLNFKQKGSQVIAEISPNVANNNTVLLFYWETGKELFAKLLQENLQQYLRTTVEKARREAYAAGWKDARGKRKRETWFSGWL